MKGRPIERENEKDMKKKKFFWGGDRDGGMIANMNRGEKKVFGKEKGNDRK